LTSSLSGGAIAGIVIGVLVAVAAILFVVLALRAKKVNAHKTEGKQIYV
jgi:hypothetical protein